MIDMGGVLNNHVLFPYLNLNTKGEMIMQEPNCGKTARELIGSQVLTDLERTAERAQKIACVVGERISGVTRDSETTVSGGKNEPTNPSYPSFFEQLRQKTTSINNSLSQIEDVMRRLEL